MTFQGIELKPGDTRQRCVSGLSIKGSATFRCDYAADHQGWAHSSKAAHALWQDDVVWGEDLVPKSSGRES